MFHLIAYSTSTATYTQIDTERQRDTETDRQTHTQINILYSHVCVSANIYKYKSTKRSNKYLLAICSRCTYRATGVRAGCKKRLSERYWCGHKCGIVSCILQAKTKTSNTTFCCTGSCLGRSSTTSNAQVNYVTCICICICICI